MTSAETAAPLASLEMEADRIAAGGDRAGARRLLAQVTKDTPDRIEAWLKLAALCRADGDLNAALAAVSGALRIEPLGFVPLLLKASLLQAADRIDEAGAAYGYALAQRPDEIPPHLQAPITQAEQLYAAYVGRLEQGLADSARPFEAKLSADEKKRLGRFTSNIARRTKPYHCEPSHFHYPGLTEREFHDPDSFAWLAVLEAATGAILREFEAFMGSQRSELVPYIQYSDDQPLRQWKGLNWNKAWSAAHLLQNGAVIDANARHCPRTMQLLDRVDQPKIAGRSPNAMFSLLAPGARIPPHNGVANTRLVCHLPLIVPDGCWFRVGAETRLWEVGKAFVFDDTIEHEAANDSDQLRVVLIFDVWHPGLSAEERQAIGAVMAVSEGRAEDGL